MGGGYLTALAAAVPGAIDFFLIVPKQGRVARAASIHALLALSLLVVYAVNLALRLGRAGGRGGSVWAPLGLSVAGVARLALAAWFGGELVSRYRIGVQERDS